MEFPQQQQSSVFEFSSWLIIFMNYVESFYWGLFLWKVINLKL